MVDGSGRGTGLVHTAVTGLHVCLKQEGKDRHGRLGCCVFFPSGKTAGRQPHFCGSSQAGQDRKKEKTRRSSGISAWCLHDY